MIRGDVRREDEKKCICKRLLRLVLKKLEESDVEETSSAPLCKAKHIFLDTDL